MQRHGHVKQLCPFGEQVFWHGWSRAAYKRCWAKKTKRCVGLEYEDLTCSAKEIGYDTLKSVTVAKNMLHDNCPQPQQPTAVTAHMFGLGRWLC